MGYNPRAGMIERSKDLLESILITIQIDQEMDLHPQEGSGIYDLQWQVRRLLAACDDKRFGEHEAGGKYYGLGRLVRLVVDKERDVLVVRPRGAYSAPTKPNLNPFGEIAAIEQLKRYQGELTPVEFLPSLGFSEAVFVEQAAKIGWEILTATRRQLEHNRLQYLAERKEQKRSVFDYIGGGKDA